MSAVHDILLMKMSPAGKWYNYAVNLARLYNYYEIIMENDVWLAELIYHESACNCL